MQKKTIEGKEIYTLNKKECEMLFAAAENALKYAYINNESERFAVAIMTKGKNIFTGASYVSHTYTLTMHAEAVALAHAANHGETEIVAITGPNCHICKQLIWESSLRSKIDTVVIFKEEGKIKQIPISKLMLYAWPDKVGNK